MDNNIRELEREVAAGSPEAVAKLLRARERADGFDPMSIIIDGETHEVHGAVHLGEGMAEVSIGDMEYIVAVDAETAGRAARARWAEMAEHDPSEFRAMVGDEALIAWAMGQPGGPGTSQVRSLNAWLDLHLDTPEEEFASYDGEECEVERIGSELAEDIGFTPTVAYRHN